MEKDLKSQRDRISRFLSEFVVLIDFWGGFHIPV